MTYAPADLAEIRGWVVHTLGVAADAVGIVGDPAHASSGGYHEGKDDLASVSRATSDYSVRESTRDSGGLTNAASALDIGTFTALVGGRSVTLRSLSLALVDACKRGDPRTRDVREVIYSPDGVTVRRWDRLGIRTTGDSSHLYHTHVSFFRDSEGRRNRSDNFLGLLAELAGATVGDGDMDATQDAKLNYIYDWVGKMLTMNLTQDNSLAYWIRRIDSGVGNLASAATADEARDKALAAALDAIKTAGVSVDTSAVLAAIDKVRTDLGAKVADLQQKLAASEAARVQLEARLSQAFEQPTTQG